MAKSCFTTPAAATAPEPSSTRLVLALDSDDMAKALGISKSQLEALARNKRFPCMKLGNGTDGNGRNVFPVEAARLYLTRHAMAWVGETIEGEQLLLGGKDDSVDHTI